MAKLHIYFILSIYAYNPSRAIIALKLSNSSSVISVGGAFTTTLFAVLGASSVKSQSSELSTTAAENSTGVFGQVSETAI